MCLPEGLEDTPLKFLNKYPLSCMTNVVNLLHNRLI